MFTIWQRFRLIEQHITYHPEIMADYGAGESDDVLGVSFEQLSVVKPVEAVFAPPSKVLQEEEQFPSLVNHTH